MMTTSEGLMWVEDSASEGLMWAVHSTICIPFIIVNICFKYVSLLFNKDSYYLWSSQYL